MGMGLAGRRRPEAWGRGDGPLASARPLVRPAPRSAMFFPLVVIVAVLPGLYALNWWDLTPPGPWWGLRSLAVLDGAVLDQATAASGLSSAEARAYLQVAYQPPLYAWLAAGAMALTPERAPWASVLPGYVAGALVVILAYLHGRLWCGPGVGLTAAALVGCNRNLLLPMQQAGPTTLALASVAAALYAYGRHLKGAPASGGGWPWGGGTRWLVAGGLALGLGLMAGGPVAAIGLPVALLHQAYLLAESPGGDRPLWHRLKLGWRDNPSLLAGAVVVGLGLLVAGPWYARMAWAHGRPFLLALLAPPEPAGPGFPGLLSRLVELAPATLPLGLYAALRTIRDALASESDDDATIGRVFWVFWLAVAALAPAVWPSGPRATIDLLLLLPLNLLAASAMSGLADRGIPIRVLNVVAPATAVCLAWAHSTNLRGAVAELARGHASSSTGLGLHLALDLLIGAVLMTRWLERWARRRDDRQRLVLAAFLLVVVVTTVAAGLTRVAHLEDQTRAYLALRDAILGRQQARPFAEAVIIGPHPRLQSGPRVVILVGTEQRLTYPLQFRLNLETISPDTPGLDAFATAHAQARK